MKRYSRLHSFAKIRENSRLGILFFLFLPVALFGESEGARVALDLAREGDYAGAAVEFRRAAMESDQAPARGGWFWASAYEYHRAAKLSVSDRMLDRAEDADPALSDRALLLRGENAMKGGRWDESAFYFESAVEGAASDPQRAYAARKLAASRVRLKDVEGAEAALDRSSLRETDGRDALQAYREGRDKRPGLGGALGMLPGFGYFYAGEWATGFRSLA